MAPKLIAAAARLCGWLPEEWDGQDNEQTWAAWWPAENGTIADKSPRLTDAGLLALEEKLKERGWYWVPNSAAWCWTKPVTALFGIHHDRATAACLAAQQEAGDE